MGIDAVITLVSLFAPKIIDIVKGIFNKKNSPEQTINVLAVENPAALAGYISALTSLITARCQQFNMDISGTAPKWLTAWRGSIRPSVVTFAFIHVAILSIVHGDMALMAIPQWWRAIYEVAIGSWFGDRWRTGI